MGDALSSIIYAGGSPADRQAERIVSQYFRDTFAPTVALPGGQHAKRMRVLASGMLYHDCFTSMVSGVAALLTLPEGDLTITEWCEALQKLLPQHVDGDLPEHSAMDASFRIQPWKVHISSRTRNTLACDGSQAPFSYVGSCAIGIFVDYVTGLAD